jgi:hypothetical protein
MMALVSWVALVPLVALVALDVLLEWARPPPLPLYDKTLLIDPPPLPPGENSKQKNIFFGLGGKSTIKLNKCTHWTIKVPEPTFFFIWIGATLPLSPIL